MINWDLIQRIVDNVPPGKTGMGDLGDAYVRVLQRSGIDHNQDEDHYHLLLKIHEMRGLTIQSRYETYLAKHGRDYAPSSFAADSTILEANSTFHIGISQRHGPLDDPDGDVTQQSVPSSVPDEFRPRRVPPTKASNDQHADDLLSDETTTQETPARTVAFRTTPLLVDRQLPLDTATRPSSSRDRRPDTIVPAKESILQRISGPSPNLIKTKLPLLADVDSDTGSEYGPPPATTDARFDRTEDGDDELGPSDLETTPRRSHKAIRARTQTFDPIRSPGRVTNLPGYMSDSPSKPGRLNVTPRAGYLSDGTPNVPQFARNPLRMDSIGTSGSRPYASLTNPARSQSPLANPRGTSTPKASKTRFMEGFSSMDEGPSRIEADSDRDSQASVPATYAGPVKPRQQTFSGPSSQTATARHQTAFDPPAAAPRPPAVHSSAAVAAQRDLEQQAYELERAYSAAGGNITELISEAKAYHEAGICGRVLERWMSRCHREKTFGESQLRTFDHLRLARSFGRWRELRNRREELMNQAAQIYAEAVQRRLINRLATALQRKRNEKISNSIVEAREFAVKRSMFKYWRKKRTRLRADRWRSAMDVKIRTLQHAHDDRILRNTFTTWKDAQLVRAADAHHSASLLHATFQAWRQATYHTVRLQAVENASMLQRDLASKRKILYRWVKSTALSMTVKDVAEDVDRRVIKDAFSQWRLQWRLRGKATSFAESRVLKTCMRTWSSRLSNIKNLARKLHAVSMERDVATLRSAFDVWILAYTGGLLARAREQNDMRQAWGNWRVQMATRQAIQAQGQDFSDKRIVKRARTALRTWKAKVFALKQLTIKAHTADEQRLLRHGMSTILERMRYQRRLEDGAGMANTFFTLRASFQKWHCALRTQKQLQWIAQKQKREKAIAFQAWLKRSQQQQLLRKKSRSLVKAQKKRLGRKTLHYWFARVVALKDREIETGMSSDRTLLTECFGRWTRATVKQGEMLSLMQSFRDVRDQDNLRQLMRGWSQHARSSALRRQSLAIMTYNVQQNLLRTAMSQWMYRARSLVLDPMAEEFVQRVDDGLAFAVLSIWKAKSTRLPAIGFHARILRRQAWDQWKAALPHAKSMREAARVQDRKLCSDVLQAWKSAYRAKIARRAAARSRGNAMRLRAPQAHATEHKATAIKMRLDAKASNSSNGDEGDVTAASDLLRDPNAGRPSGRRRSLYRFS